MIAVPAQHGSPDMTALRAALASEPLLGFDTAGWQMDGANAAKAAFVGVFVPANDEIINAYIIGGTTTSYNEDSNGSTVSSGESTTIIANPGVDNTQSAVGATVWFKYTPLNSGQVKFTTDGSNFDTTLQAYTLTDTTQPVSYANITKLAGASNDDDGYAPPRAIPGKRANTHVIEVAR